MAGTTTKRLVQALRLVLAGALWLPAAPLLAQEIAEAEAETDPTPRKLDEVVVQGQIVYRDRLDTTAPVLSYDLSYFQRFEPLTVGDMLKRVPSVAFVSDVLEYDGVRLRGLDPAYTQILINGKKVPGAGNDRSFFVDRIPAELVERIEILRNSSASRSGDAVAGAINIVLRNAYEFEGAYLRAGALHFDDGELKGTGGAVYSGALGPGRVLLGVNAQGRYNPKDKRSDRFDEPGGEFDNREDQSDVRDGTDYSANVSWRMNLGDSAQFALNALGVRTDREETERSLEYNVASGTARNNLLSENDQFEDIDQVNRSFGAALDFVAFGGDNSVSVDFARFDDDSVSTEIETSYDDDDSPPSFDETEGERSLTDTRDEEFVAGFKHAHVFGAWTLAGGLDLRRKDRDFGLAVAEVDTDVQGGPLPAFDDFERTDSTIEEHRAEPWLQAEGGDPDGLRWELGVRFEDTDVDVRQDGVRVDNNYSAVLPSGHLKWALDEHNRVGLSVGRTVRRPDFDFLLPALLEEQYGDNDFRGNPLLAPERATGIDWGYERRLGQAGVVGVNVFWRDVEDLIELVNTGAPSATALDDFEEELEEFLDDHPGARPGSPGYPVLDADSFVYSAANVGDGQVWGVELDLSTPLSVFQLPDTGVFLNLSWLDSEVDDAFGERRFNNQARYVWNLGFIHDLPDAGISFGASYRRQGRAESRLLAEEVVTRYGADLEAFVEKRFGDRFAVRLTGSNLLDASKDEEFRKFDNADDQLDRDFDEYELETESSGPAVQLIARYSL